MKKFAGLLLLLIFTVSLAAQDLYMPRNIKAAYQKGTRSLRGVPGLGYWQNKGVYDITVRVEPVSKTVTGSETIIYTNNSPDTLKELIIRFVNNLHKPQAPRYDYFPADFLTDGLKIKMLSIDRFIYKTDGSDWGTVSPIELVKPIFPGQQAQVRIEWSYPLSRHSDREGQIDSQTFFCAYAYPRISVYDDYNGWDRLQHVGRQEFYNDFNDYDLKVQVPKNYVVWATGTLQNAAEVLLPEAAERLKLSFTARNVIHVATADQMKEGKITVQQEWNTWHFTAQNITDMCFALSNHYVWDAGNTMVDMVTGKQVSMQAAYKEGAADFKQYVDWGKYCLQWFSSKWPGVPYPYPTMTAIQGFADMEYPMMVNDASIEDLKDSRLTLDHEVAHTYFPFYMGTNETRYAFMDEGWATAFEYLIGGEENGKAYADSVFRAFRVEHYINDPSAEQDQPVISMSSQLSGVGYGNNAYVKPALAYLALKDLLGDTLFKKALHQYMANWNGKHPIPWDFFYSFNTATQQNLNWFWNNWFFSNHYIDLRIKQIDIHTVQVENIGGFAIPFDVKTVLADGSERIMHYTPAVWQGAKAINIKTSTNKKIKTMVIDGGIFMDATPADNTLSL
ncbi:M1 family metallopeptidase [Niabella yanshanensis]|uniref:M1 family metallopeptidase n=1 Tax=Niabella yanshanensis TaxID=577386 RepID=A0ABZ0W376_9BACT|nr:M1 family metallopeptidase [Niabella yanshanensis]WQD37389.1 M1 family metallopeptidase [Niabella yanshanensis]